MTEVEKLFELHGQALRNPAEIFGTSFATAGITPDLLSYEADAPFTELLAKLKISLIIGREYENLVISLNAESGILRQTFFHLPHPSGIVFDPKRESLFIAATRNPNQIIEFKSSIHQKTWVPVRSKYYPGHFYFHDLALIGGNLYANSVGQNGIIEVDIKSPIPETICWWPKCIEKEKIPQTDLNYIQLNSIAAGESLEESYFSATADEITPLRPGHLEYPVDQRGVIFSGKTRETVVRGLTRPHSARIHLGKVWLDNSGYGEFGYIENSQFVPIANLSGWTRGLSIHDEIAFVGISRILPKFKAYAPGIEKGESCAVAAIELSSGKIIGRVKFPYGNQIFAIETVPGNSAPGFAYEKVQDSYDEQRDLFYNYRIKQP